MDNKRPKADSTFEAVRDRNDPKLKETGFHAVQHKSGSVRIRFVLNGKTTMFSTKAFPDAKKAWEVYQEIKSYTCKELEDDLKWERKYCSELQDAQDRLKNRIDELEKDKKSVSMFLIVLTICGFITGMLVNFALMQIIY